MTGAARVASANQRAIRSGSNDVRNPYRDLTTRDLLANLECRLWDREEIAADLEADPASWAWGEGNFAFTDHHIGLINQELDRRRRLRHRAGAPPWPAKPPSLGPDKAAVKAALSIERYLEARGVLLNRQTGGRTWACCPLPGHEDGSPSFCIDPEKRLWHCFGCLRGGDLFTLHQHMTGNVDFVATLIELAAEAGVANRGAT